MIFNGDACGLLSRQLPPTLLSMGLNSCSPPLRMTGRAWRRLRIHRFQMLWPPRQEPVGELGRAFPAPLYGWIQSYRQLHPEMQVSYAAVGSEKGIRKLLNKLPGSILRLKRCARLAGWGKASTFCHGSGSGGAVYNLPEWTGLCASRRKSSQGSIWERSRAGTPARFVTLIEGSDCRMPGLRSFTVPTGSGTAYAFTDFLSKTSPEWKAAVGVGSYSALGHGLWRRGQ